MLGLYGPEPGWLVFVDWASVPWKSTYALPLSHEERFATGVAPHPAVKVVRVECRFGAREFMWASWALEIDDARWLDWPVVILHAVGGGGQCDWCGGWLLIVCWCG